MGYSNGANIAGSLMLRRPELLAAAVLLRPMVPFVSKKHPDPSGKSVCLGAGQHDPIVTAEETLRVEGLFRECGAGVFLQSQPHGHEIGQEAVSAVPAMAGMRRNCLLVGTP